MDLDFFITYFIFSTFSNPIFDMFSIAFSIAFSSISLLALLMVLYFIKRDKRYFVTIFAIIITVIVVQAMKAAFHRPRPMLNYVFMPPIDMLVYSFPSGHAALSFVIMTLFAHYSPKHRYWAVAVAILAAFSRIYLGAHYLSDVIAGASLGTIISLIIIRYKDKVYSFESWLNVKYQSLIKQVQ
jgi:undecaprenyl-diphosphatase